LVQRSEQFDNGYWGKLDATIAANAIASPIGTLTADKLIANTNNANHGFALIPTLTSGQQYTFSLYVKAAEYARFILQLDANSNTATSTFNLNDGSVTTAFGTATITSAANGWFRVSVTGTLLTNSPFIRFRVLDNSGNVTFIGDGTSGIYLWGAQLNEGTLKDYFATETRLNIPRLDYSLGSCPSILVEPQRTNLALRSEEFDNVAWSKTNASVTANATTSPSGILNADIFAGNGISGTHFLVQSGASSVTSGVTYTTSFYAKKNTNDFIQIVGSSSPYGGNNVWANYDLNLGLVGSVGTSCTATIQNVGNGWFRCTMTAAAVSTTNASIYILGLITSSTAARGEVNTLSTSVFIWGAQLEAGAYPTSYIPTTSASVTRNADVISKTGISSLIGQTEGTIFFEGNVLNYSQARRFIVLYQDANNYMSLRVTSGNDLQYLIVSGGATSVNITTANIPGNIKIALAYKNNDFVAYLNGTQVGLDTSGSVPTTSDFYLGCDQSAVNQMAGGIKVSALWKERLSNDELTALTTL
jgi:hypothetical protein